MVARKEELALDLVAEMWKILPEARGDVQKVIDTYTEWKSVYVDFSGRLQRAQIDSG